MITLKNILVATDFSQPSDAALAFPYRFYFSRIGSIHKLKLYTVVVIFSLLPVPASKSEENATKHDLLW